MRPETSRNAFEALVTKQAASVAALIPSEGIRLMLEFYRQHRAEGITELDENGDTLLYEWGTYDWGRGSHFEISMTRQFIDAGAEGDNAISQLRLIFYFPPTDGLLRLEHGARWCDQPEWLSQLELFISKSKAYQTMATTAPEEVELIYTRV